MAEIELTPEQEQFKKEYEGIKIEIVSKVALLILDVVKEEIDSFISSPEIRETIKKELARTNTIPSMIGQMLMDYIGIVVKDMFPVGEKWWLICPWNIGGSLPK